MSKRRELEGHIRSLEEIDQIMKAMRNLAVIETQKVTRLLAAQDRVVSTMHAAGTDFLKFYPRVLPQEKEGKLLYLVIGSERGFCGDYNDRLLASVQERLQVKRNEEPVLLVVGRKLAVRISDNQYGGTPIEGPSVAEEVQSVMIHVLDHVRELHRHDASDRALAITVFFHAVETGGVHVQALRPFEESPRLGSSYTDPPLLNLRPRAFVSELVDLYLFSLLHKIFYSALLAENRARVSHLEAAIQRLEREASQLERKRKILRQEEITEEIEVLMLSGKRSPRE